MSTVQCHCITEFSVTKPYVIEFCVAEPDTTELWVMEPGITESCAEMLTFSTFTMSCTAVVSLCFLLFGIVIFSVDYFAKKTLSSTSLYVMHGRLLSLCNNVFDWFNAA